LWSGLFDDSGGSLDVMSEEGEGVDGKVNAMRNMDKAM